MKLILLALSSFVSLPVSAEPYFVHCYDFGCKSNLEIRYDRQQWSDIKSLFAPQTLNPDQEKQAIRKAVGMMESFSGEIAGTSLDKGGNYPGYDIIKQMDCIDESTNTFQYLSALEDLKLLKWHKVEPKKRRTRWLLFDHWTAVISDNTSGRKFAVDSWYRDNGEPPYIQLLKDWQVNKDFPVQYNPD
jgi:hypothetical protein